VATSPLRIALLGGVPPSLGGGGLEVQVRRTGAALRRLGLEVFDVASEPEPRPFEVLHAFSSGPDVHFALEHWRRSPAPLVVSPVIVVAPGAPERRQRIGARLPLPAFGPRERRGLLRRAAAAIALTEHEAWLIRDVAGRGAPPVTVIGNGVDPVPAAEPPPGLAAGFAVLVGTVSARKRQAETVGALGAAGVPAVVVGGHEGGAGEQAAFRGGVEATGGRWLGELDEAATRAVVRRARALVHLSGAEGQSLAVLEALAEGTPAIVSPLPSNRELARDHPGAVRLCAEPAEVGAALAALPAGSRPAPRPIPTWDAVAARIAHVYRDVLGTSR
jgi:glycosyltransferase involved in cell wall biosynthesis